MCLLVLEYVRKNTPGVTQCGTQKSTIYIDVDFIDVLCRQNSHSGRG